VDIDGSHYTKADAIRDFRMHPSDLPTSSPTISTRLKFASMGTRLWHGVQHADCLASRWVELPPCKVRWIRGGSALGLRSAGSQGLRQISGQPR
jgi:hypothetical protein